MKRYRLVTSWDRSGGYTEFSAASDEEAITHAEAMLYGARIVRLGEIKIGLVDTYRPIIPQ